MNATPEQAFAGIIALAKEEGLILDRIRVEEALSLFDSNPAEGAIALGSEIVDEYCGHCGGELGYGFKSGGMLGHYVWVLTGFSLSGGQGMDCQCNHY